MTSRFSRQAQADLDQAVDWLLGTGSSPDAAVNLLSAVLDAAELLGRRPLLGRIRPELLPAEYRFWSIPKYRLLLVYDPDAAAPTILRILSTDRDFRPLLSDLQD